MSPFLCEEHQREIESNFHRGMKHFFFRESAGVLTFIYDVVLEIILQSFF